MKAKSFIGSVLATCLGLAAVAAHAQQTYSIRAEGYPGCKSKQVLTELQGHLQKGDKAAYSNALAGANMSGRCTMFKKGESVFVIGMEVDSNLAEIRRRGESTHYWTNLEALRAAQN